MSSSHPLKRGVIAVSAALSLLAAAAPLQAAVVGTFDPPFGGNNPDLANVGYQGTFNLNVSNGCYGQTNTYVYTGSGCSITVNSITVDFYDYTSYAAAVAQNPTAGILPQYYSLASYTLDSSTGTFAVPNETNYVTGAYFGANDELVGFDTLDSNPFYVNLQCIPGQSCSSQVPIVYNGTMLLYFISYLQPEVAYESDPAVLVDCNTPAVGSEGSGRCSRYANDNSNPAPVTVTSDSGPTSDPGVIPEPETMPLTLIGLAALTANSWRKRRMSRRRAD